MVAGSTSYAYDAENRMTAVSGAATATFVYDGDGNRVKGVVGGVTTTYIGNYFEWSGSTTTMKKYYYAGGTRVAERKGTTLYWLLSDHLGSTSITATSSGSKTAELRYKAWGETRYTYGTTQTTFRYTGQREESSLGLYWYASRWYSPGLGRFVSPDTIIPQPGSPQAWDRYGYANNNPVIYTDPTGHWPDLNFLNPFSYDTISLSFVGLGKAIFGIDINLSLSVDTLPLREAYEKAGIVGLISEVDNTDIAVNVSVPGSVGVSAVGFVGVGITGSDGGVLDQNGVSIIGFDGVPINYSIVIPPTGQGGFAISGNTLLTGNAKNGIASSQIWALGAGIGYGDISVDLLSVSDYILYASPSKQIQLQIPFFNNKFKEEINEKIMFIK